MADKIETQDDYTGAGVEGMEYIENEEQFEKFMLGQNDEEKDEESSEGKRITVEEDESGNEEGEGQEENEEGEEEEEDDGEQSSEAAPNYPTMLHYLNDRFDLQLNVDKIPADLDPETQAETIGDMMERMQRGVRERLSQYDDVRKVLQDEEVAAFIVAKQEGKTLRDYALEFASSTDGMDDEQLILEELKLTMPGATDDQRRKVLEGLRNTDAITDTADTMRKARTERENKMRQQEEIQRQQQEEQNQLNLQQEIQQFGNYVSRVKDVYGVPMTDKMRREVFEFTTKQDGEGLTQFDRYTQSDEGLLLAAMGVLHMQQLIGGGKTTVKNSVKKSIFDTLAGDPSELQSSGGDKSSKSKNNTDDIAAINRF